MKAVRVGRKRWRGTWLGAALAAVLLGAFVLPASAQSSGPEYVVQPGDSLYSIAQAFGTSVEALQAANGIADPDSLFAGQRLLIPGLEGVSGTLDFHPMEAGETLWSVSQRFGIPTETVVRLSRIVNPSQVYIGQPVIVPLSDSGARKGRGHVVGPRKTLLGIAASWGANPWSIVDFNSAVLAGGVAVPGSTLVVPGGEADVTALPWPMESLGVRPLLPEQGRTVSVAVRASVPAGVQGRLDEHELHFEVEDGTHHALQGIHALAEPGLIPLTIRVTDEAGDSVEFTTALNLRGGGYLYEPPLVVDPSLIDPAVVDPEFRQVQDIVGPVTGPARYWNGPFQSPSAGGTTSYFGSRRSYNGSGYDAFHSGIDFSGGTGTPILAPAPGRVVFAGELKVRGLATVIDHGWGVYTGYWHQSRIDVAAGQDVRAGQEIGLVGATGRVTGPHLHWEVWVGGVQVDPAQWTQGEFP